MADVKTCAPLTRASVQEAHALIQPLVHRTPVVTSRAVSALASPSPSTPVRLWFKCENLQRAGAFKARGAFHAVERLRRYDPSFSEQAANGVVTHSSGNHAAALALAARESRMPAHVVMPTVSPPNKVAATKSYGGRVVFSGSTSTEREAVCAAVVAETGARLVPPYDHPDIILGQGTLGLELQEQFAEMRTSTNPYCSAPTVALADHGDTMPTPRLDAVLAPCGGGGMLSGVALSFEGTGTRVFGAEPNVGGADDAGRGYRTGERVTAVSSLTIADGLRTPLGLYPWSIIYERRLVAGFFSVDDDEIKAAMRLVYERMKLVVEPSAAVPLAVALYNKEFRAMVEREAGEDGWDLGIVFSGGNVHLQALGDLLAAQYQGIRGDTLCASTIAQTSSHMPSNTQI